MNDTYSILGKGDAGVSAAAAGVSAGAVAEVSAAGLSAAGTVDAAAAGKTVVAGNLPPGSSAD